MNSNRHIPPSPMLLELKHKTLSSLHCLDCIRVSSQTYWFKLIDPSWETFSSSDSGDSNLPQFFLPTLRHGCFFTTKHAIHHELSRFESLFQQWCEFNFSICLSEIRAALVFVRTLTAVGLVSSAVVAKRQIKWCQPCLMFSTSWRNIIFDVDLMLVRVDQAPV